MSTGCLILTVHITDSYYNMLQERVHNKLDEELLTIEDALRLACSK